MGKQKKKHFDRRSTKKKIYTKIFFPLHPPPPPCPASQTLIDQMNSPYGNFWLTWKNLGFYCIPCLFNRCFIPPRQLFQTYSCAEEFVGSSKQISAQETRTMEFTTNFEWWPSRKTARKRQETRRIKYVSLGCIRNKTPLKLKKIKLMVSKCSKD